jgi:transposase
MAVALWCEVGEARRFSSSRKAVRHSGLEVTVPPPTASGPPSGCPGRGSPLLRWALYKAGKCATREGSPDHAYYQQVRERRGGNRAALSVGRKIARRSHHILRRLGDQALAPV